MNDDRRVVLMLTTFPDATRKQIAAELAGRTAPMLQRAADAGLTLVTGTQIPDDPLEPMAKETGRDVTLVGALVEITGPAGTPDEALLRPIEGFGNSFGGVFDMRRSAAALGSVRKITEGPTGPVILVLGARKLPRLSQSDFHEYWAGTHAPLALSLMPPGTAKRFSYQQVHADAVASARVADAAGVGIADYAGILEVRCAKPEDFLDTAAEPSFARKIYDDELNFAEQAEMRGGFIRV